MFRTSWVHYQEDSVYTQFLYGTFSMLKLQKKTFYCAFVSQCAAQKNIKLSNIILLLMCCRKLTRYTEFTVPNIC